MILFRIAHIRKPVNGQSNGLTPLTPLTIGRRIFFEMKPDFRNGWLHRRRGRVENLHEALQHIDDGSFVDVEPGGQCRLQFLQLPGEFPGAAEPFAHLHESAHDKHAQAHGLGAVQDAGTHNGAVFGEREGENVRKFEADEVVTICDHLYFFLRGEKAKG